MTAAEAQPKKPAKNSRKNQINRLVDAHLAILEKPDPDPSDKAFLARQLVQATLPHSNPKGNPAEWFRTNGNYTLSIKPGYKTDQKTGKRACIGYPYGIIPRLLMFWLNTEVLRTNTRKVELGASLADFMRQVGLSPETGGGERSDARRLREQMERLFKATISFEYTDATQSSWLNMPVSTRGQVWWDHKQPHQGDLFGSWIELGEDFYKALKTAPIPLDTRALRELKKSPLALDLYAFLTHRSFSAGKSGKAQRITWHQLGAQLGADYGNVKDLKKKVKQALQKIELVYPCLKVTLGQGVMTIHPETAPAIGHRPSVKNMPASVDKNPLKKGGPPSKG